MENLIVVILAGVFAYAFGHWNGKRIEKNKHPKDGNPAVDQSDDPIKEV